MLYTGAEAQQGGNYTTLCKNNVPTYECSLAKDAKDQPQICFCRRRVKSHHHER